MGFTTTQGAESKNNNGGGREKKGKGRGKGGKVNPYFIHAQKKKRGKREDVLANRLRGLASGAEKKRFAGGKRKKEKGKVMTPGGNGKRIRKSTFQECRECVKG